MSKITKKTLLLTGLLLVGSIPSVAAPWVEVVDKREIHYRVFTNELGLLDISCSRKYHILLDAVIVTNDVATTANFQVFVDGKLYPKRFTSERSYRSIGEFGVFWEGFRKAKSVEVVYQGKTYPIPTDNLEQTLPVFNNTEFFQCRPVNFAGDLLMD